MAQAFSRRPLTAEDWEIRFQSGRTDRKKERKKERKKDRHTESPSKFAPILQTTCENSGFLTAIGDVPFQGNS